MWVPGHSGIEEDEIASQLAKKGSEHPLMGPEPACGILKRVKSGPLGTGRKENARKSWESTPEQKHAKDFLQEPSAKRARELIRMSRNQLRLLTGYCHLKGHLFELGLLNSPTCE
jgi:hypothetical protein